VVLLAIIDENRIGGDEMNIKEQQTVDHRAAISRKSRKYRGKWKCHLISKRGSCWVCGQVLVVSPPPVVGSGTDPDLPVVLPEQNMEPRRDE